MTYNKDELDNIAACIDITIKTQGIQAARVLLPLFEKTEAMKQEVIQSELGNK